MKHSEKTAPKIIYLDSLKSKKPKRAAPFIFQLLLLYMALVGFIYSVATSVNMPIGLAGIALITFPCILISALFTLDKRLYIPFISVFGGAVLCVLFLLRSLRGFIFDSFEFCYNLTVKIVIDEGYVNYQSAMTEDITEKLSDPNLVNSYFYCVVIVLAIVFSVIFTSTMMKRSLVWVSILPCFLVLTPSLFFGAVPSGGAFCLFISGVIGCYIESISYFIHKRGADKNKKYRLGYAARCAANGFCSAAVMLAVSLTVASVVYSSNVLQLYKVREVLDNVANKLMNNLFYEQYETSGGAIGGLLESDVLEIKTPKFRGLPVMTVKTHTNYPLYLRGWISDDFSDQGWNILDDEDTKRYRSSVSDEFDQYTQMYRYSKIVSKSEMDTAFTPSATSKLGFVYDTVSVQARFTKSLMMFIPSMGIDDKVEGKYSSLNSIGDRISFFADERPSSNRYVINAALQNISNGDFYLKLKNKQNEYIQMADLAASKQSDLSEDERFMRDERSYLGYVRETYMSVPENADFLKSLAIEVTSDYDDDFGKALALERYFKSEYRYAQGFTQDKGTPLDKVKFMIEKSKTGYCTYYATAMTLMMRSLGVPARYVTGYHASAVPETGAKRYTREILDENYHAWVEVYFDGIGWLTFDPTPGSGVSQTVVDYAFLDDPNLGVKIPDEIVENVPPITSKTDNAADNSDSNNINNSETASKSELPRWAVAIIIAVSVLIFLACAAVLIAVGIKRRFEMHRKYVFDLPPTETVRALYPNILRLLGAVGYKPQPGETLHGFAVRADGALGLHVSLDSVIDTLEMSQFSENPIDTGAASAVREYFDGLSYDVFNRINIFKKYYYMATINKKKNL